MILAFFTPQKRHVIHFSIPFLFWLCLLCWKVMAESTVRWFILREKRCLFAEIVRLIRQANRAFVSIAWCSILFIFICLFVSTYIWSCDRCSLHLEGEQVVNIQEQDFQDAATTKHYRRQASLSFWYPIYHWYILHTCVITHKDFIGCTISLVSWGIWRIINA